MYDGDFVRKPAKRVAKHDANAANGCIYNGAAA